MVRLAVVVALAVGCAPRGTVPPSSVGSQSDAGQPTEVDEPSATRLLTPDGAFDCAANAAQQRVCDGEEGCILVHGDGCRPAANACESVVPATVMYGHRPQYSGSSLWPAGESVTFAGGDPCASLDPSCAYDSNQGVCEPFERVAECPQTAEQARSASVSCMHPDQAQLVCTYPGVRFECRVPWRPMGGMQPPPGANDVPVQWFETQDYDAQGCPATETARQAACEPPTNGGCVIYDVRYTCPNGAWEGEALPPRP